MRESEQPTASAQPGHRAGVLLALFELSAESEGGADRDGEASASATSVDPRFGGSTALLEALRSDATAAPAARTSAAAAGRQLGRFRLIQRLGGGSQAEVWKAIRIDPKIEVVALKVLDAERASHAGHRGRFLLEAELGARLSGPSLLPTYEVGEEEGALFLAMPLVEGGTLADLIAIRRRATKGAPADAPSRWATLSVAAYRRAVVRLMALVSRALASVHTRRVAHRDIKPANILLDRDREDRAYLCDFGLCRTLDEDPAASPTGDGAGTPLYMAPEKLLRQADADEVRGDIYSLGVTLFEALTLVHPFPTPKAIPQSCLAAYLAATTPPRPRQVDPRFPSGLEAIIVKAMDRDPGWRYGSVAAMADELEGWLAGAPGRVHVVTSRVPSPKLAGLRRWPVAARSSRLLSPA